MKPHLTLAVILSALSILGVASASVTFHQNQPLTYDNGTTVTLPAGTYGTVEKISNVWYVDGHVYPSPAPKNGVSLVTYEEGALLGVGGAVVCIVLVALYLRGGNRQEMNQ